MPTMRCHCGKKYNARSADLRRGWGYSCSKHCAAVRRKYGKPRATRTDGPPVRQTRPSPDTYRPNDQRLQRDFDMGYVEHPLSGEALGQDDRWF